MTEVDTQIFSKLVESLLVLSAAFSSTALAWPGSAATASKPANTLTEAGEKLLTARTSKLFDLHSNSTRYTTKKPGVERSFDVLRQLSITLHWSAKSLNDPSTINIVLPREHH